MTDLTENIEILLNEFQKEIDVYLLQNEVHASAAPNVDGGKSILEQINQVDLQLSLKLAQLEIENEELYNALKLEYLKIKYAFKKVANLREAEKIEKLIRDYESKLDARKNQKLYEILTGEGETNEQSTSDAASQPVEATHKIDDTFAQSLDYLQRVNVIDVRFKKTLINLLDYHGGETNVIDTYDRYQVAVELYKNYDEALNELMANVPLEEAIVRHHLVIVKLKLDDLCESFTKSFMANVTITYDTVKGKKREDKLYREVMSNLATSLYGLLSTDLKSINRRYKELALKFHPDKILYENIDTDLKNNYFSIIKQCQEYLVEEFFKANKILTVDCHQEMKCFEKRGDEYFEQALRYYKCLKARDGKANQSDSNDLFPNLTNKELNDLCVQNGLKSYNNYYIACRNADTFSLINEQLLYRHNMALCYYICNKLLEAQLITVSEIILIKKARRSSVEIDKKRIIDLEELMKKLHKKIQGEPEISLKFREAAGQSNNSPPPQPSKSTNNELVSYDPDRNLLDLRELLLESDLKNDERVNENLKGMFLVLFNKTLATVVPDSDLLEMRVQGYKSDIKLGLVKSTGIIGANAGVILYQGFEMAKLLSAGAAIGMTGALPILLSVGTFILSSVYSLFHANILRNNIKKFSSYKQKKEICLKLNEILKEAFERFKNEEYLEFLEALSKPFYEREEPVERDARLGTSTSLRPASSLTDSVKKFFSEEAYAETSSLLKFKQDDLDVDANHITDILLEYNFTPDCIGLLLNMIANVLFHEKVKIRTYSKSTLRHEAQRLFEYLSKENKNAKLKTRAVELDDLVTKDLLRVRKRTRIFSSLLGSQNKRIGDEMRREALMKGSFYKKFLEIEFISKINLLAYNLIINGINDDTMDLLDERLAEINKYLNENGHMFYSSSNSTLEFVEFIFWVFNHREAPTNMFANDSLLKNDTNKTNTSRSDEYDDYFVFNDKFTQNYELRISQEKDNRKRAKLLIKRASHYYTLGKEFKIKKQLEWIVYMKKAKTDFENSFNLDNKSADNDANTTYTEFITDAWFKYIVCLIQLRLYKKADEFIELKLSQLTDDGVHGQYADKLYYTGIVKYNLKDYDSARISLREAEKLYSSRKKTDRVRKCDLLCGKIDELRYFDEQKLDKYKQDRRRIENRIENCKKSQKPAGFTIVSIDGGGVRGVLPAMILNELQRRCDCPLVDVTSMFAGCSTGAMLSAGLVLPKEENSREPMFYPYDMYEFYVNESRNIFSKNYLNFYHTYDSGKLQRTLEKKLGTMYYLNDAICELVVPAVKEKHTMKIFSSYRARTTPAHRENYSILDVLMSTTAAPTYFQPHKIAREGYFLDGGILANNPSQLAFDEAVQKMNIPERDINVVSLGTGFYVNEPYSCKESYSFLYWAQNIADVMIDGQQNSVDIKMNELIGERYRKVQFYLDEPIKLDDHTSVPRLVDMAKQFIVDEDDLLRDIVKLFNRNEKF